METPEEGALVPAQGPVELAPRLVALLGRHTTKGPDLIGLCLLKRFHPTRVPDSLARGQATSQARLAVPRRAARRDGGNRTRLRCNEYRHLRVNPMPLWPRRPSTPTQGHHRRHQPVWPQTPCAITARDRPQGGGAPAARHPPNSRTSRSEGRPRVSCMRRSTQRRPGSARVARARRSRHGVVGMAETRIPHDSLPDLDRAAVDQNSRIVIVLDGKRRHSRASR